MVNGPMRLPHEAWPGGPPIPVVIAANQAAAAYAQQFGYRCRQGCGGNWVANAYDVCPPCRQIASEKHAEQLRLEQERIEREERDHSARVARHEAEAGWSRLKPRVEWLNSRIAEYFVGQPTTVGAAVGAGILAFFVVLVLICLFAAFVTFDDISKGDAVVLGFELAFLLSLLAWPAWTFRKLFRVKMRQRWIEERNRLLMARGCGDAQCRRCTRY